METESLDLFFYNNEKIINKLVSKILFLTIPISPILIFLKFIGIYNAFSVSYLIKLEIIIIFLVITNFVHVYYNKTNSNHKYFLLCTIEIIIFFISLEKGLNITITYTGVILLSSMYFNSRFTIIFSIVCTVLTGISYLLQAKFDPSLTYQGSNLAWALAYSSGSVIEMSLISIICCYLAKEEKKTMAEIIHLKNNISKQHEDLIFGLSNIVEAKDYSTGEHIKRTSEYVKLICIKMQQENLYPENITSHSIQLMALAAPFHDIGKLSVPDYILNKPGKLTAEEFEIIKKHPLDGAQIIENDLVGFDNKEFRQFAKEMALYHHERIDGTGYPYQLKKDEIPISARIMSVADILDALLSVRPYKNAFSLEKTFKILNELRGSALDPEIVDIITSSTHEINQILQGVSPEYD